MWIGAKKALSEKLKTKGTVGAAGPFQLLVASRRILPLSTTHGERPAFQNNSWLSALTLLTIMVVKVGCLRMRSSMSAMQGA
mmetsp:Transcript_115418/g.180295  ORF Transcript_115418/g.180295 Transcript_115418/m.180295 type:complete len:82 (-) Transcript_115418:37-282(-)